MEFNNVLEIIQGPNYFVFVFVFFFLNFGHIQIPN